MRDYKGPTLLLAVLSDVQDLITDKDAKKDIDADGFRQALYSSAKGENLFVKLKP